MSKTFRSRPGLVSSHLRAGVAVDPVSASSLPDLTDLTALTQDALLEEVIEAASVIEAHKLAGAPDASTYGAAESAFTRTCRRASAGGCSERDIIAAIRLGQLEGVLEWPAPSI